jgi:hypothetical protein
MINNMCMITDGKGTDACPFEEARSVIRMGTISNLRSGRKRKRVRTWGQKTEKKYDLYRTLADVVFATARGLGMLSKELQTNRNARSYSTIAMQTRKMKIKA